MGSHDGSLIGLCGGGRRNRDDSGCKAPKLGFTTPPEALQVLGSVPPEGYQVGALQHTLGSALARG